jgi:hypothetical protein
MKKTRRGFPRPGYLSELAQQKTDPRKPRIGAQFFSFDFPIGESDVFVKGLFETAPNLTGLHRPGYTRSDVLARVTAFDSLPPSRLPGQDGR